ncbi:hypothetical protein [Thiohalomonas denitrificans]|uniref:Uncharacterized protein n=1 Tax=Thiohalomonas denitrificans TaxID=415747 RepID=A0A1G5QMK2_9GAMM|nr:hypothetical protein [Thiohalomonas denitrificans]SCZ63053.1 hypothetical protein SAMN03097708_02412 [Thiohalomonas denitrificans]
MRLDPPNDKRGPPVWQLAFIGLVLLGTAVALMQWAQTLSITRTVVGSPGMFPYQGPITSVHEIAGESAKANLLAKDVVLADVEIDQVIGERVFLISEHGETVPVVLFGELTGWQHDRAVTLEAGQRIRIYGVIRMLRSIEEIVDKQALAADDTQKLRGHEIFISAFRVAPLPIRERVRIPRVITAVSQFVQASDPEALQAREVVLDKVKVLDVLGDHAFRVGDESASVPVALLGEMTRRQADDVVQIRIGQMVRIYGVIRLLRSQQEIEDILMVSPEVAAQLRGNALYVSALRVVLLEPSS